MVCTRPIFFRAQAPAGKSGIAPLATRRTPPSVAAAATPVTLLTSTGLRKSADITVSGGSLIATGTRNADDAVSASAKTTTAKFIFEATTNFSVGGQIHFGIDDGTFDMSGGTCPALYGEGVSYGTPNEFHKDTVYSGFSSVTPATADVVTYVVDTTTGTNNVNIYQTPSGGSTTLVKTLSWTPSTGEWWAWVSTRNPAASATLNFAGPFVYSPVGYSAYADASVSNSYSLSCATGSFSLTGGTAGLLFGRILPVSSGSFVLTGNAVTPAITMPAARGQFVLTGNATGLSAQRKITAAFGPFTLTGRTVTLAKGFMLSAGFGSFALSGTAAALSKSSASSMGASVATFTLTGRTTGLFVSRRITANVATFALTGRPAGLSAQRKLAMAFGAYSLSGSATGLFRGRKIAAGAGAFVLSGSDALLRRTLTVSLGGGLFAVVGFPATLKRTVPGPSRFTVSRATAAASVRPRQQEQRRVANLSRGRR